MKKKIAVVIVFIIILVFPLVSWPIASHFDVSLDENREKAEFPKFGNDVFAQFDAYFADRAPYRNMLIKTYKSVELKLQLLYQKMFPHDYYTTIESVIIGKNDWLFFTDDNSVEYYKGTNLPTEEKLQLYVERAQKVNDYFKSQGKEFVIMIAPNKEQIYSEFMPVGLRVVNEIKRLDVIYNYFQQHSDVKLLYPKDELIAAKENYNTYFQQDTHWNDYGAYVGAKAIFNALNIQTDEFEPVVTEMQWLGGDLARFAALPPASYTGYSVSYRPEIEIEYSLYSKRKFVIESSNKNGKSLFALGDSFTLAGTTDVRMGMIEILSKEFENTLIVHRDDYHGNYSKEIAAADTIVLEAVERYDNFIFSDGGLLQKFIDAYGL